MRTQADDHYRLAQSYLSNASPLMAEQEIRKALTLRPDDARYLECLALIHPMQVYQAQGTLNLTRLQLAEEAYRAALRQADAPPSVLVNYSTVLLLRERPDEAIVMAQRALQVPGYDQPARAYTNIGIAYLKKGALTQAAEHFRKAIDYQANLPEVHHNLGLPTPAWDDVLKPFGPSVRLSAFGRPMLMPTLVSARCSWKRGGKTRLGLPLSVSLCSLLGVISPLICGSNLNPLPPSGRVICRLILTPLVAIYVRSVNGNRCRCRR
jgi:tetratricopeptide (TPR) repeat protein